MLTLGELRAGGKPALASVLAKLESSPDDSDLTALLTEAYLAPIGQVIGLTGPPGVGKSTLAGALINAYRAKGKSVGVIAIDPSSRRTGGALLGDRVRLRTDPDDQKTFIRSMAARDQLGGLAEITFGAMVLMRAVYDVVLVETVGVGQSETDISMAADTVVFCVQPGSGDSLQFMKAGIVEIPDIVVVTKGDMGAAATRAKADVKGALGMAAEASLDWGVPVKIVTATSGEGLPGLMDELAEHWHWLGRESRLVERRRVQAESWLKQAIKERYGREGLKKLGAISLAPDTAPFGLLAKAD
ncbi:ArgK/MeaB family GTPase [Dongia sedimenti]|uniref:Methylmalonyl Co-A mutase-associated GTPase MeaB n=1 Tax=Dongia sedimenti TaxID=3064282 RepID=A0ABU0YHA8_9PROT|nr:methylmalonyl Co-A mutase-associated GTPase MeaB [Rhodospirillaceae bacterium R-7]